MIISEIPLPAYEANAFIMECLNQGTTLAQLLKDKINLSRGSAFAIAPDDTPMDRLLDFHTGNIIKGDKPTEYLSNDILTLLNKSESNCIIFEYSAASRTDLFIPKLHYKLLFYNNEVYALITREQSYTEIIRTIKGTNSLYLQIGVVSNIPLDLQVNLMRQDVSEKLLISIANNTQELIFMAYDSESYVIWRRQGEPYQ